MKEKEDKLRLVKQILIDDNVISLKDQAVGSTMKAVSPNRDARISRKVTPLFTYVLSLCLNYAYK